MCIYIYIYLHIGILFPYLDADYAMSDQCSSSSTNFK